MNLETINPQKYLHRMFSKFEICELIIFIQSHKNGYTIWKGETLSRISCHNVLLEILHEINISIISDNKNHEIMKRLSKKSDKSLENLNILRWWDETFAYPNWSQKTETPQNELFEKHTVPVTKQTILLWNYLEWARLE
jgi:hypothetical protein